MLHTRPPHFLPLTWMFNSLAHSYLLLVDVMPVLCCRYGDHRPTVVLVVARHRIHIDDSTGVQLNRLAATLRGGLTVTWIRSHFMKVSSASEARRCRRTRS